MKTEKMKRAISGFLVGMTMTTSFLSPMISHAAESSDNSKPPLYEEVKDFLSPEEVVVPNDIEVVQGEEYDIRRDFRGLEIPDKGKVKVTFQEAKNSEGADFSTDYPDEYKAVYYVSPVSESPMYQISRNVVVKEKDTEESQDQITAQEVLSKAAEQIDLQAMEEGEVQEVTLYNDSQMLRSEAMNIEITKGPTYYYKDYGLGTLFTSPYYININGKTSTAYCVEPSKPGPGSGVYDVEKLVNSEELAKVCYYGNKMESGSESFFAKYHQDFSDEKQFVITHLAAAYAYGASDTFYGANKTAQTLALDLYDYAVKKRDIPYSEMSFSPEFVKAYKEDDETQFTEKITFNAHREQSITFTLPEGVVLNDITWEKKYYSGETVTLKGGTTFYLEAPLSQTDDVDYQWKETMTGNMDKEYSAYTITTGGAEQNLAFIFADGTAKDTTAELHVEWVNEAKIDLHKTDGRLGTNVEGAIYGVYKDPECTKLIAEMPATDEKGRTSVTLEKRQPTVYVKEISVPEPYVLNPEVYPVTILVQKKAKVETTDKEQLGNLSIYKSGEVLTGADVTEDGVQFQYQEDKLKGAKFEVVAGEDIKTAAGVVLYKKGDSIAKDLETDESGMVSLKNLHLGKYLVRESKAPEGFSRSQEIKEVELSYAGQNVEAVFSEINFKNERKKLDISVTKKEKEKDVFLADCEFSLYAKEDIKSTKGDVLVKADTLIEKQLTDKDGKIKFKADLPAEGKYYVKETKAPVGYATFKKGRDCMIDDQTEDKERYEFDLVFEDEVTKAEISKQDIGGKEVPGAKLTVLDSEGNIIESWVSTDKPHYIEKLPFGEYILREEIAPNGYLIAEDISFKIKDTGEIQKVVMKDERAMGKVIIYKKDESTGNPLAGVEFELRDSDGKVLETLITDDNGYAESKLYEISAFKDGVFDGPLKYVLVETKTLNGYVLDPMEREVIFEYKDDKTPVVEVQFEILNKKEETKAPRTGDKANVILWAMLAGVSAIGAGAIYYRRKKNRK